MDRDDVTFEALVVVRLPVALALVLARAFWCWRSKFPTFFEDYVIPIVPVPFGALKPIE